MADPWSGKGWKESDAPVKVSPCHGAKVYMSMGDGVMMGSCAECNENCVRRNPVTGKQEIPNEKT